MRYLLTLFALSCASFVTPSLASAQTATPQLKTTIPVVSTVYVQENQDSPSDVARPASATTQEEGAQPAQTPENEVPMPVPEGGGAVGQGESTPVVEGGAVMGSPAGGCGCGSSVMSGPVSMGCSSCGPRPVTVKRSCQRCPPPKPRVTIIPKIQARKTQKEMLRCICN
jgi:hypothetical protein